MCHQGLASGPEYPLPGLLAEMTWGWEGKIDILKPVFIPGQIDQESVPVLAHLGPNTHTHTHTLMACSPGGCRIPHGHRAERQDSMRSTNQTMQVGRLQSQSPFHQLRPELSLTRVSRRECVFRH